MTAYEVEKLISGGHLAENDLDERALNALKEFDSKHAPSVLQEVGCALIYYCSTLAVYE